MRQLVGLSCAVCGKEIGSIVEGEFCRTCSNPVHHACKRPTEPTDMTCGECIGNLTHPVGMEIRSELAEAARRAAQAQADLVKPKLRFGFLGHMTLGFSIGAGIATAIAFALPPRGDRVNFTALYQLVASLGALGAYLGHEVGSRRNKEVGFKPGGSLTPGVATAITVIVVLGTAIVVSSLVALLHLIKGPFRPE